MEFGEKSHQVEVDKVDNSLLALKRGKSLDLSIEHFVRMYNEGKLNLRPPYQRNEVINVRKASGIIESAIIGIPLPPIYLFMDKNGKYEVIDGQQRLITFLGFFDHLKTKTKLNKFTLTGLNILQNIKNKNFEDDVFKHILNEKIFDFKLKTFVFEEESGFDPELKYEIFERLNKRPFPIKDNSFELWNCIYSSNFTRMVKELASNDDFLSAIARCTKEKDIRMRNEDDIVRHIVISKKYDSIKSKTDISRKLFFTEVKHHFDAKTASEELNILKKEFLLTVKKVRLVFGNRNNLANIANPHRKLNTTYPNLTLLDVLLSILRNEDIKFLQRYRDEILESFKDFFSDPDNRAIIQNPKKGERRTTSTLYERVEFLESSTVGKIRKKYNLSKVERIQIRDKTKIDAMLKKQNGICLYCKNIIKSTDKVHVDHLTSIDNFGNNSEENLVVMHELCNLEKSSSLLNFNL